MKILKFILVACLLAGGVWGVFVYSARPHNHNPLKEKDVYYCPMHPQIKSDRPGECPICFMKLIKRVQEKEEHSAADPASQGNIKNYATVKLHDHQRQLIGVKTAPVERKALVKTIRAFGYVAQNIEMYKIQNEFIDAYVEYVDVFRDYKRVKDRRRTWEIHRDLQARLLEAESRLLQLGLNELAIVRLQQIDRKEIWNQPEILLFDENRNYWVIANIFEDDLGFVDVGQKVDIELSAYHETAPGIVRSVAGSIDPQTRLIRVLVELNDYKGQLAAQMTANVIILVEMQTTLAVPKSAVMDTGTRKIVYVEKNEGVFEPREIEVAWAADNHWSVKNGLNEHEMVVVEGNFLLDSESRLQANFDNSAQEGGGHAH